jgi:predicted aspartyl protease
MGKASPASARETELAPDDPKRQDPRRALPALVLLLVVVALVYVPRLGRHREPRHVATSVAMLRTRSGTPVIEVPVNDRLPARFLVDTGMSYSLLRPSLVRKLGLPTLPLDDSVGRWFRTPGRLPPVQTTVPLIRLGYLEWRNTAAIVVESEIFQQFARYEHKELDGILGMNAFQRAAFELDPERRQVYFWLPGGLPMDVVRRQRFRQGRPIHLRVSGVGPIFNLPVRLPHVNGEELMLDTGSNETVISPELARRLKISVFERAPFYTRKGARTLAYGMASRVELDGYPVYDLPVRFPNRPAPELRPRLGMDVLRRFRVLIDVPNAALYVEPIPPRER